MVDYFKILFHIGGYEGNKIICINAFDWKSVGQELRPNDLTTDLPRFQHGNRAFASKDMKKSQGKHGPMHIHRYQFSMSSTKNVVEFYGWNYMKSDNLSTTHPIYRAFGYIF